MADHTVLAAHGDREFWRAALLAGGFSSIPRWSLEPKPGVAEREVPIPETALAGLRRLAAELAVSPGAVLLAAHAKVLAALCAEREVTTGYVAPPSGAVLPCSVDTGVGTWSELLGEAGRAEAELLAHAGFPVDDLCAELGLAGVPAEVLFDPSGAGPDLAEHAVLSVSARRGRRPALRLRYRTDVLDAESADRIAGYHLTALSLMAADPDAEHRRQTLLSAEELRFQRTVLTGRRRVLPDRRAHELFEQRVRDQPDDTAAVCGDRRWTYQELNAHANQLARALLARGLRREGVVAVVTERNLDWMASVLAIFKAGGAYLPIEPHFPAGRVTSMLTRADCRLVLTERGSTALLDQALGSLPGTRVLFVDDAYAENQGDGDLGMAVAGDQLAYIYFTSGSTGEPKGAMCEHAGMLNHLYAKIDDLEIGRGTVVAQIAPQCFDISLWQLVAGLLVGGQTLLVAQDVILDVSRLVDTIDEGRVAVLQVVPSYLEVVVSYLARHPRRLPHLRYVSVTGEALKNELAQRWFATQPGIKLVNAYGLTETSDDTNHEVMDRAPRDGVPLGAPIANVTVAVVDEQLSPVPLGAPGLIVFSGVCVGRGYVNDPERTRQVYLADPHHPSQRLYRGGDYGRWRPDRKLEFLGRRDNQVKIRGFRIEIGEIENALLRVPGVRQGAVVVAEGADRSKHLVAFYSGPNELDPELPRGRLAATLPEYMVPTAFHWLPDLPLTANGKVDNRRLVELAGELRAREQTYRAPSTPTELRLATAWASVLGIPLERISRRDHFFDLGGTSLSSVKLAIAMDREISLADINRHPLLTELAMAIDDRLEPSP